MMVLAFPRLVSNVLVAPAAPVLRKIKNQQPVTADELATAARALERSIGWSNDGELRTDLGLMLLLSAEMLPEGDLTTIEIVGDVRSWLKEGIALGPASPYAWARLAYAEATIGGWTPFAVDCLRMSLLTAPRETGLLWTRLRLGMLAWPHLSLDDKDLIARQIEIAWNDDAAALAALAREMGFVEPIRTVLENRPDDLAAFDAFINAPAPTPPSTPSPSRPSKGP